MCAILRIKVVIRYYLAEFQYYLSELKKRPRIEASYTLAPLNLAFNAAFHHVAVLFC